MVEWLLLLAAVVLTVGTAVFVATEFSLVALDRPTVQRALDAGEIYSLETLVNLYCDAGRERDLALRLAEQNYRHKRDESARAALARAQAQQ